MLQGGNGQRLFEALVVVENSVLCERRPVSAGAPDHAEELLLFGIPCQPGPGAVVIS